MTKQRKTDMTVNREMPRYVCHKKVWALKIKSIAEGTSNEEFAVLTFEEDGYAPLPVDVGWYFQHKPVAGGYYVVYQDGYKSFSPAKAFEDGYTLQRTTDMTDQTNKALKAVRDEMGQWIADPMWAGHAEMPKMTLKRWHHVLHAALSASAPAAGSVPSDDQIVAVLEEGFGEKCPDDEQHKQAIATARTLLAQYGAQQDKEDAERWKPIETAPLTEEIWAYNGEQGRMIWSEGTDWALWVWSDELMADVDPSPDQPTHWMPLPAAPQEGK